MRSGAGGLFLKGYVRKLLYKRTKEKVAREGWKFEQTLGSFGKKVLPNRKGLFKNILLSIESIVKNYSLLSEKEVSEKRARKGEVAWKVGLSENKGR